MAYADIADECSDAAVDRSAAGDHSLTGAQLGLTYVTAASTFRASAASARSAKARVARGVIE